MNWNNTFLLVGKSMTVRLFIFISVIFLGIMCFVVRCSAQEVKQRAALGKLELQHEFAGSSVSVVGFSRRGTLVLSAVSANSATSGEVVEWAVKSAKVVHRLSFSKGFSASLLTISSGGGWLLSGEDTLNPTVTYNNAHQLVVRSIKGKGLVRTINLGAKNGIMGLLSVSDDDSVVVVRMDSLVPYGNTSIYGKNRLEWLNLMTNRVDKRMAYQPANELDRLLISSDKKYLLGLFYSEAFNPTGESDYAPSKNQFERHGFVDVINSQNSKILWHLEGTDKQPVGDPFFFVSPTRFVSSDTLFDIATHKAQRWSAITPTRKCLAVVPNHPNCALFLTPSGLQLRNWQKNKTLVSRPNIKKSGRILFSPDLKMFSFKRGSIIQFWKFDPKWLHQN